NDSAGHGMSAPRSIAELPGPRGLPLIGSAHRVKPSRFHSVVEEWSKQYGPILRFMVGPRSIVAIADPEVINTVLRERPDAYRRTREVLRNSIDLTGTFGVFHAEGDDWRHMRRLAVTALNSNHLQRYFDVVRTCTERLYARLKRIAETGEAVDIGGQLTSFTVDVTSALAFGHDLNTLERGESELQQHIQQIFYIAARRLVVPVPYWRYFKLSADRAADRSWKAIENAVLDFIGQARERIKARPELREAPENFLEGMIAAQETDDTYTDEEIVGNVFTLLFAGEDTTAHTMAWTTWLLAREPEIQRRWAAEADAVLGDERSPRAYDTVGELHYGEAVLRESMRLKPVAPILGVEPLADSTLMDTRIPAGTRTLLLTRLASLQSVSRANEFDPDRWLNENEDGSSAAPDQKSFLAFGAGPRFCPGRNLAFLESKSAMAMIARNFELELDASAGPVTERFTFTVVPEGLRVRLRERIGDRSIPAGAAR
ncbi:MAG: cytochrome P450, partial [Solirubrobacteraceae bacterium]